MAKLECDHLYGVVEDYCDPIFNVNYDNYSICKDEPYFEKYTYCPYCKMQLHTPDGKPLDFPKDDDCQKRGCAD